MPVPGTRNWRALSYSLDELTGASQCSVSWFDMLMPSWTRLLSCFISLNKLDVTSVVSCNKTMMNHVFDFSKLSTSLSTSAFWKGHERLRIAWPKPVSLARSFSSMSSTVFLVMSTMLSNWPRHGNPRTAVVLHFEKWSRVPFSAKSCRLSLRMSSLAFFTAPT